MDACLGNSLVFSHVYNKCVTPDADSSTNFCLTEDGSDQCLEAVEGYYLIAGASPVEFTDPTTCTYTTATNTSGIITAECSDVLSVAGPLDVLTQSPKLNLVDYLAHVLSLNASIVTAAPAYLTLSLKDYDSF